MDKVKLGAKKRTEMGRKTNKGRKAGKVPAILYGKEIENQPLWIDSLELQKLIKKHGESIIIDLSIDDNDDRNVIINETQRDPVSHNYSHVDFYQVNMKEKIETEVELVFVGESEAVKTLGGVLVKNVSHVKVKCLPVDLPSHIDVNISKIKNFDDHIAIKDLNISEKVEIEADPETVVALVTPPRSEEELSSLDEKVEGDVTQVEGVVKEEGIESEEGNKEKSTEEKKEEK